MNYDYRRSWQTKVLNFYDGDSGIALRVDVANPYKFKFQLENINCPELGDYLGFEAKSFAEQCIGNKFCIFSTYGYKDDYGRYLGDIYLDRNSLSLALKNYGYCR